MIVNIEVDYKIRNLFKNNVDYHYFEYDRCFVPTSFAFSQNKLLSLSCGNPVYEKDTFNENHVIHHDFRKLNSILKSLKDKDLNCQAFKVKEGWKIYKKIYGWKPLISVLNEEDFWLSPCNNFYIHRHLVSKGRKTPIIVFDIKPVGVDSNKTMFRSYVLDDVLEDYYKPDLHISVLNLTKDFSKYKDRLIENLK